MSIHCICFHLHLQVEKTENDSEADTKNNNGEPAKQDLGIKDVVKVSIVESILQKECSSFILSVSRMQFNGESLISIKYEV